MNSLLNRIQFPTLSTLPALALALAVTTIAPRAAAEVPDGVWVRPGYELTVAIDSINTPRFMEFDANGTLYVSVPKRGEILSCRDKDGDGAYESITPYVTGHPRGQVLQGLEWHDGWLWFAELNNIYKSRDVDGDGKADSIQKVVGEEDLPAEGKGHRWRALLIHKGRIYTHVGDQTNATDEPIDASERKKIWTFNLDGGDKQLFASGVRNTERLVVRPGTDEIWGVDHDIDMLADKWEKGHPEFPKYGQPITDHNPPAELNHYVEGGFYGHPYILGKTTPNINFLDHPKLIELAAKNINPAWLMESHSSANSLCFYDGDAIPGAHGDAFIAKKGGWNATEKVGYSLSRVLFEEGRPYGEQNMVVLLKDGTEVLGRPADCIQAPDGSILFSDDTGHKVYRLSYVGE